MQKLSRSQAITALAAAMIAIVVLAAGIARLELQPGNLFNPRATAELMILLQQVLDLRDYLSVILAVVLLISLLLSILTPKFQKSPYPRKKGTGFVQILLFFLALYLLGKRQREQQQEMGFDALPEPPAQIGGGEAIEPPVIVVASSPPVWLAFIIGFLLIFLLLVLGWVIWRRTRKPAPVLDLMAQDIQTALKELQFGEDIRNVILRCYARMCYQLNQQRGIERPETMTAREFEQRLLELGLPPEPVAQLTRLFESVRYGAKTTGPAEEQQAVASLTAILRASERMS